MSTRTASDGRPARVGLALSGGGFRASLFHIGVLARLAELDLLRHVEVISTVSGGSIIGALYYLHLRNLLRSRADADIGRDDYLAIVDRMQREFPLAIRQNLRMRTFAALRKNVQMYRRDYSRSDRIAELYEELLYRPHVEPGAIVEGRVALPLLTITPPGDSAPLRPFSKDPGAASANQARLHKVPELLINTTALNTGHNFQFTTTWLGEPPARTDQGALDGNLRLRRADYRGDGLPAKYEMLPLGVAVAASAAVPGIFPPLALTDLYPDLTPQLVDGGAHDNQGIEGLLDYGCTHLLVSDASGQMNDVHEPDTRMAAVLQRSNALLMDRVREEQFRAAAAMQRAGEIEQLCFFHMKACLRQAERTWQGGVDAAAQSAGAAGVTPYGVPRRTQELLAGIRTDLDAFSEIESQALMADGYLIARHHLDAVERPRLAAAPGAPRAWAFLAILPYLCAPEPLPAFEHHLAVGHRTVGKSLRLLPWVAMGMGAGAAVLLIALLAALLSTSSGGLLHGVLFAAVIVAAVAVAYRWGWRLLLRLTRRVPPALPPYVFSPVGLLLAAAVVTHLRTLTVWRLRCSVVTRLAGPAPASEAVGAAHRQSV